MPGRFDAALRCLAPLVHASRRGERPGCATRRERPKGEMSKGQSTPRVRRPRRNAAPTHQAIYHRAQDEDRPTTSAHYFRFAGHEAPPSRVAGRVGSWKIESRRESEDRPGSTADVSYRRLRELADARSATRCASTGMREDDGASPPAREDVNKSRPPHRGACTRA